MKKLFAIVLLLIATLYGVGLAKDMIDNAADNMQHATIE